MKCKQCRTTYRDGNEDAAVTYDGYDVCSLRCKRIYEEEAGITDQLRRQQQA